jgi:hypothetical protein
VRGSWDGGLRVRLEVLLNESDVIYPWPQAQVNSHFAMSVVKSVQESAA